MYFCLIVGLEMKMRVGADTDASTPRMATIYINYSNHPASKNVNCNAITVEEY